MSAIQAKDLEGEVVGHIDLAVEVTQTARGGWVVIANAGGERKQFGGVHSSKKEADFYAKHMFSGADRWTHAARVVQPEPDTYPGDPGH